MRYFLFVLSILSMAFMSFGELHLDYKWKFIDFVWENDAQRIDAIVSGRYNSSAITLFDVDKAPDGRVFVTLVRDKGVPVGLATISKEQGLGGPLLRPYPDWSWYKGDCRGISAGVYQVDIKCNHLFVVDGGRFGLDQVCTPQLLIFDLATDRLVKRLLIPFTIAHNSTGCGLLASVFVVAQNCTDIKNNGIVLMTDTEGHALIVYNPQIPKLCRIHTRFMYPTENGFIVENQYYPLDDGIYGLLLINKELYYAALGGSKMYKIHDLPSILNCEVSDREATKQTELVGALSGQTAAMASENCVVFFSSITDCTLLCADATKQINAKNNTEIIARDSDRLQFISGMKNRNGELLLLSNRYQHHVFGTLNIYEDNFHIFSKPMSLIKNHTKCFTGCNK